MMEKYNFEDIERKWQEEWHASGAHRVREDADGEKYYALAMFPYPSGRLHMGHVRNYSIVDVLARYKKMQGYNVLHPIGWDAFGLPAENAAIKNQMPPAQWTYSNIEHMRGQLQRLGLSYDWDREVTTCRPEYYRWTQWIFLELYKQGLVYRREANVNWCPSCATVLANEQAEGGVCERCEASVELRSLEQWFLKITEYSEQLLNDLEKLRGWPEKVKTMQRNWIGRSEGVRVEFEIEADTDMRGVSAETGTRIAVFTTRVDTLFGVSYLVLAPEHPLVEELVRETPYERDVAAFVQRFKGVNEQARTADDVEKEGMFIGRCGINPLSGERVPIWIANYVLLQYGTGAVMGVPAHDSRDFAFATKYGLDIRCVILEPGKELGEGQGRQGVREAYCGEGKMIHSGRFSGMESGEAKDAMADELEGLGRGIRQVNYRLRDWLISRQRYWGAPIPMVLCPKCGDVPVPEEQLPVLLPEDIEFKQGENPIKSSPSFGEAVCPCCGGKARRETDTMDTFMCSSWYFLRYCDPRNEGAAFARDKTAYWMNVDQYVGGVEHAIMHLLYARFLVKALRDCGHVGVDEPFENLLTQGMVCKDYLRDDGRTVVVKMSKKLGNVVSPEDIVSRFGADTARLFILFAAPPERDLEWNDHGVEGCYRFLNRVWRLVLEVRDSGFGASNSHEPVSHESADYALSALDGDTRKVLQRIHATIKKVTHDVGTRFNFNTAISAVMELVNELYLYKKDISPLKDSGLESGSEKLQGRVAREAGSAVLIQGIRTVLVLLAPFVPHIAEELWQVMGQVKDISSLNKAGSPEARDSLNVGSSKGSTPQTSIFAEKWPRYREDCLEEEEVMIVFQVNGKVRDRLLLPAEVARSEGELRECVSELPRVQQLMGGKTVVKTIVVPGKLVNIVVK
ncbi:MAG: leucine--tRNA ligase [Peptococcaceae bacterium]|nr:leucine--tRNA ligase [Peptococcaceae bacterium]